MSDNDKPWTADDIRRNAPNWSLQCDGKLLEYMKNLSKIIEERGNRSTHNMHSSMLELDRTKVALENATNQLMALQHKQFIENRVYDDDETLANIDSVPITNPNQIEQPKMSVNEALQNAISTGMQMVDKYFDKVTIELSDSEDEGEEVQKSVLFRPKNLYEHRPLPYLIGSKDWHEKWHIGLVDEDSDGSGNENVDDEASISSSSSSSHGVSISSNVPVSLSESENPTGANSFRKPETQDLFQSSSEENISKLSHEENNSAFRKQSIDAQKIEQNAKPIDSREVNSSNTIFRQQKQPNVSHVIPTLIDSDPPELDDVSSTRIMHKPANLFLDDENDPDDFNIFDDKTTKTTKSSSIESGNKQRSTSTISQIKSINLFADDDDDNFDSFLSTKPKTTIVTESVKSQPKITNIFDDDDDDFDDELFLQPSESTTKPKPTTSIFSNPQTKKDLFTSNLFNDEPPDDDDFGIKTPDKVVKQQLSNVKESSEKPKEKISPEKPKIVPATVELKKPTDLFSNKLNLFDDDDEDDDAFEKLIASTKNKKTIEKKEVLFESDDNEIDSIVQKDEKSPEIQSNNKSNLFNPVNLFSDTPSSDEDEQLFSNKSTRKEDVVKKPAEILKRKTEFYNDFSDTVTVRKSETITDAIQSKIMSPSHEKSIESERSLSPQSEKSSIDELKTTELSETDGPSGGKRSDFLKKLDAFSNPNLNVEKEETATDAKPRQPKKLNIGNIDINVAALLPGAKPAKSIEKSESSSKESADEVSDDVSAKSSTITKAMSEDNVDDSGRLTNLNRNRAKNLARRPSTRAGRKQQYKKSLQSEDHADESSDQTDKPDPVPAKRSVITKVQDKQLSKSVKEKKNIIDEIPSSPPKIEQKPPNIEAKSKIEQNLPKIKSKLVKVEPKSPTKKIIFDDELFDTELPPEDITVKPKSIEKIEESEIPEKSKPLEQTEIPEDVDTNEQLSEKDNKERNLFAFLDDQDDEDDDFLAVQPKDSSPELVIKSEPTVRATPAYIDELPPELDAVDDKPISGKNTGASAFLSENALSLFGDDEEDDFDSGEIFTSDRSTNPSVLPSDIKEVEDDWSPYPPSLNPVTPSSSSEKKPTSANVSSLFDDNSDNDELFGSPAMSVPKVEPKQKKSPPKSIPSSSAITKASIFGDDDDDDLFGEPPPLPEPVKQTQPKKSVAKIFSSDSSDDDLFGGGGKSNKRNPLKSNSVATSSMPKVIKDSKSSDKLFSDSEDDDLFGTKSKPKDIANKKVLPASLSKTVKEDAQKTFKPLSQNTVNNDPLADLLK